MFRSLQIGRNVFVRLPINKDSVLDGSNTAFLNAISRAFATSDIVIDVNVSKDAGKEEILRRVDEEAAHDMMVLARIKASQGAVARIARFVKTRVIPYESLPGVTYEQQYNAFHRSFKVPTTFAEFIEAAPALYRKTTELAQTGDWDALRSITSRSAFETLQCLYGPGGNLRLSTEILQLRRAIIHDVSLVSDKVYKTHFDGPRPPLDPTGMGGDASPSYTALKAAEGRALGVRDGLEVLQRDGTGHLVVKCEIEADVRDTVTVSGSAAPIVDQTARHVHMWTLTRGPIRYEDNEAAKAKGAAQFQWRQAGHRGLGYQYLDVRGEAKFEGDAAWRVSDVSPWSASLSKVVQTHTPEALPRVVVNKKVAAA